MAVVSWIFVTVVNLCAMWWWAAHLPFYSSEGRFLFVSRSVRWYSDFERALVFFARPKLETRVRSIV